MEANSSLEDKVVFEVVDNDRDQIGGHKEK